MKYSSGPTSLNIKLALVVIGVGIAIATLIYTQNLVAKLQEREKEIVQLHAKGFEYATRPESSSNEINFIFNNIIRRIDFPMILTDEHDKIISLEAGLGYRNIDVDTSLRGNDLKKFFNEEIQNMRSQHNPILVRTPDGKILNKMYYGDTEIIKRLRFYPYLQIIFALLFITIAYSSFSYIKRNEQSNIWVGMSKETAHQLGTPISSLMGWNEILKMNYNSPDKVIDTADEIESDLNRLNKITTRFSKIGSKPELVQNSPYEVIQKVVNYFQRRLPQTGKTVSINLEGDKDAKALMNSELFEWVIENLIKNALDAIENKEGKIAFLVKRQNGNIDIEVSDNGKGIETGKKKDVFRPGYSTKKRGWGLGLSLSKRIVKDYHKGKIFVKSSVINEGTTFKIILQSSEKLT